MKRFRLLCAAACATAFAVLALAPGCESAETNDVTVSPGRVTLSPGGSVALSAHGWDNFRWTLSNAELGMLSATVGKTVVYTATGGEGTQQVTATAIGSGVATGSSSTNSTAEAVVGYSASAVITQH